MKRIINTFKNGTPYTKRILLFTILSVVGVVGFALAALILKTLLFFFGSVICVFIAIALIQTLSVKEYEDGLKTTINTSSDIGNVVSANDMPVGNTDDISEMRQNEPTQMAEERMPSQTVSPEDALAGRLTYEEEKEEPEELEAVPQSQQMMTQMSYDEAEEYEEYDDETDDMDELSQAIAKDKTKNKKKKTKNKKKKNKKQKAVNASVEENIEKNDVEDNSYENEEYNQPDYDSYDYEDEGLDAEEVETVGITEKLVGIDEEEEEKKNLKVIRQASDEELESYTSRKIKKTLHKYKVKRDHRKILIDYCEKYFIKQTPAYIWIANKELHMLLIEQEPRELIIPLLRISKITYQKKVEVNSDTDYPAFHKKNLITDVFRDLLPDYMHSTVQGDMSAYKNLYGFGPGIYVTNRSATQLFDLLAADFEVDDKVTTSTKVNHFFKDAYKSSILLKDNVIDANGYADRISITLNDMAKSSISYNEFKDTLNLMIKNKLITQEFAMYYMGVRDKNKL